MTIEPGFGNDLDDLDDLDGWRPESEPHPLDPPSSTSLDEEDEQAGPVFANPEEFVRHFLSPLIRRRLGGSYTWCAQWWAHAEGLMRITALWETWEHYRTEGALGMSTWMLHHLDPHLNVLLSKDGGPFSACKPDRHTQLEPLPSSAAPSWLWSAAAFSDPSPAG
ncbi:DUF4913 domain-containing protein [Actinomadura kijaniata]|uniref:DUF4913 domain-containing protein n=1 Tax=Actinomadura kijaniata TaxID=46161 RepID=UPI003F1BDE38